MVFDAQPGDPGLIVGDPGAGAYCWAIGYIQPCDRAYLAGLKNARPHRYIVLPALLRGNYNGFFIRSPKIGCWAHPSYILNRCKWVRKVDPLPCNRAAKNGPTGLYNGKHLRASSTTFPCLRLQSKLD